MDFLNYLSAQDHNIRVSFLNLRPEVNLYFELEALLLELVNFEQSKFPDQKGITYIVGLLALVKNQCQFSFSTFLRGHLHEAHNSTRVAIDAAFNFDLICHEYGTWKDYLEKRKGFAEPKRTITNLIKTKPESYPLSQKLIKIHSAISRSASHADFDSFTYRFERTPEGEGKFHTFSAVSPEGKRNLKFYFLNNIHIFTVILLIFGQWLGKRNSLDPDWETKLLTFLKKIENLRAVEKAISS